MVGSFEKMTFELKPVKMKLAIQRSGERVYPAEKALGAKAPSRNEFSVFKEHERDRR